MKTIFRYANTGLLMAVILALGAVAGFAQNPCEDVDGKAALDAKIRANYKGTLEMRIIAVAASKEFLEKYGSCPVPVTDPPTTSDPFVDYLKKQIPVWEEKIRVDKIKDDQDKLVIPFNTALKSKNWDEVYRIGKEILAKYPEEFRDVELALGSIGYDESFKNNLKYNDDTLKYAKMSIADLEAGKKFSASYGVPKDFVYKSKENALGWMNMIVGYITHVAQKNKPAALPYLYKATQSTSTAPDSPAKNPIPFELIGFYYFDELDKLTTEIKTMAADQPATDTEEIAKAKVAAIKAKVALSNGTAERAMDAFARAFTLAKDPAYKAKMKTNVENAYNLRFAKKEGVDAWIAATMAKPFPNPTTPVTPISDPEPVTTTTTSTTPPSTVKPAAPTTTKTVPAPGTKPVTPANGKPAAPKPQAKVKKAVVKRKAA